MGDNGKSGAMSGLGGALYVGRLLLCILSFGFIYPHAITEGMDVRNPTSIDDEGDKARRK